LPDTIGFGGAFVGVHASAEHGDVLVVAGGANFPHAPPWQGGPKVWTDRVQVLRDGRWQAQAPLPKPLAYGATISTPNGVVLIGGMDETAASDQVIRLRWTGTELVRETLPSLPRPSAFHAAAAIGSVIYVAAGQSTTDPTTATKEFWRLDLAAAAPAWESLPAWPGDPRNKAVGFAQSFGPRAGFFLVSGETATREPGRELELRYLSDGWRFDPRTREWTAIAAVPEPVAAAAAVAIGQSHALVFSGSTGRHVKEPLAQQPSFPRRVLAYDTITDTWTTAGEMPLGVVTSGATALGDRVVIVSGETRPGVRTPKVQVAELTAHGGTFGVVDSAVVVVYLASLVGLGMWFSRREKTATDFFLAGRRIPWWAAGLSIYATQLSAITFLSMPALSYAGNWVLWPGSLMILAMAPLVIAFFLPFFRRLSVTTAYEYLERRFNLAVRLFGSASFILFQLVRMAIVVYLPALALASITGIDVSLCILAMGVLATAYTVLGGMEAVVWTDVLQALVLLGGVMVSLLLVVLDEGGIASVLARAETNEKLRLLDWTTNPTELGTIWILVGSFLLQLGPYVTDQAVIQRYLATRDERSAARGIWLNGLLSVPGTFLFFLLGTGLWVFFSSHPAMLDIGAKNDAVFPLFIARRLPAGVSGLVIAGVFAASMSSLDSSMHSISTSICNDWLLRLRRRPLPWSDLAVARVLTLVVGAIGTGSALVIASFEIRSLFLFFQRMLGLLSSGLVAIFLLGVFARRSHASGVLTGAIAATLTLAWVTTQTSLHLFLWPVVGIGTGVAVGYLASLVLRPSARREHEVLCYANLEELVDDRSSST